MTRATVALAVLALWAGAAAASDDLALPPVRRAVFDNGLRVLVAEYHELPLVEVTLIVGAGAAQDPPGEEGLAALTAATLQRGAGGRSAEELAEAIESLGAEIGAAAGTDGTVVTAEFLADDFAAGLDLLGQVVLQPAFARDEVRRARDEQAAAILAALENPSAIAATCFDAFLYGTHPYGRPVIGLASTVPGLDRGAVRSFYERWYRPNNTLLVLVGDVDAAQAVNRLRETFGAWALRPDAVPERVPPPPRLTARRVLLVDKPDATQAQIRFGNLAIARNDPDWVPAVVANTILGGGFSSILVEELRIKRSLTYGAWSTFDARLVGGDFQVGTFTKSATTVEALELALSVAGDFRTHPPDPAALTKAKGYLRGQFFLRVESPNALAARLAEIEFHGLPADDLATYRARVDAVTPADVARVAAEDMPPPDAVAVVVVGKAAEIAAPLRAALGEFETIAAERCETLAPRR